MARYPMFKEGDKAYIKSSCFGLLMPQTLRQLLDHNRTVTIVKRQKRNRGEKPKYVTLLGDWTWRVEAQYLAKIERKTSV